MPSARETNFLSCMQMLIVLFGSSSIMLTFMFHHSLNLSYAVVSPQISLTAITLLNQDKPNPVCQHA